MFFLSFLSAFFDERNFHMLLAVCWTFVFNLFPLHKRNFHYFDGFSLLFQWLFTSLKFTEIWDENFSLFIFSRIDAIYELQIILKIYEYSISVRLNWNIKERNFTQFWALETERIFVFDQFIAIVFVIVKMDNDMKSGQDTNLK